MGTLTTKVLWCQELRKKNTTPRGSTSVRGEGEERVVEHRQMAGNGSSQAWSQLGTITSHAREPYARGMLSALPSSPGHLGETLTLGAPDLQQRV